MQTKIITLCRGYQVDIFHIPEDFDEQIIEAFKAYTDGTSHEYTYVDKLGYIDHCIERINGIHDPYERTHSLIKTAITSRWDEDRELVSPDDIYCFDMMEKLYAVGWSEHSLHQQYGCDDHHEYDAIQQLMCRIIKIIMNFEWDDREK